MISTLQVFDSRDAAFAALTDPIDWRKTHTVTYLPTTTDRAAWRLRECAGFVSGMMKRDNPTPTRPVCSCGPLTPFWQHARS
jgi:hypothetical protein